MAKSKKALNGTPFDGAYMDPNDLTIVGHDTRDGPEHRLWDERHCGRTMIKLDEVKIQAMDHYGCPDVVLVRKNGDRIEVLEGRFRTRTMRVVNERRAKENKTLPESLRRPMLLLPVVAKRYHDDGDALGVMIMTNELRTEDGPLVKAAKGQRLLDSGKTEKIAALTFGLKVPQFRELLSLLDLHPDVQDMVRDRRLWKTTALRLVKMNLRREEQLRAAEAMIAAGQTSAEDALRVGQAILAARSESAPVVAIATGADPTEAPPLDAPHEAAPRPARTTPAPVVVPPAGPTRAALRKLVRTAGNGTTTLPADVLKALRWVLGELEPQHVGGLTAALRAAGLEKGA